MVLAIVLLPSITKPCAHLCRRFVVCEYQMVNDQLEELYLGTLARGLFTTDVKV
jgi:hypothetical protein